MIERLVVWGGLRDLHSHRHIHRHFHETARKMGIDTVWADDLPASRAALRPGTTVIAADVWAEHLPPVEGVRYVLHNVGVDHPVMQAFGDRVLRLQVWTNDAYGEEWDLCRQFDRDGKVLFQPWGSDLLPEEFLPPVFNGSSREVAFIGAIWSELYQGEDLGNFAMIEELRLLCSERGLAFRHLTHVSDATNVQTVRDARLAPAFAGGWQVAKNYLPCRVFKNAAYGALAITNVPKAAQVIGSGGAYVAELEALPLSDTLDWALRLKAAEYVALVRAQQRVAARYTYRQSLEAIDRALDELAA